MSGLITWWLTGALLISASWRCGLRQHRSLFMVGLLVVLVSPLWLGWFGSLSYGTVGLAAIRYARQTINLRLAGWIALAGIVLYLTTLGIGSFDMYSLGYQPQSMLVWVACSLCLAWLYCPILALAWLGGLGLRVLGAIESDNLWDCMLDPFIVLYALGKVVRFLFLSVWSQFSILPFFLKRN